MNELAKLYGGGGHKNASGARLADVELDEIIPKVLKDAAEHILTEIKLCLE